MKRLAALGALIWWALATRRIRVVADLDREDGATILTWEIGPIEGWAVAGGAHSGLLRGCGVFVGPIRWALQERDQ